MKEASCSEGRGFESQHPTLDEHFFIIIWCKIELLFAWKRPEINEKEAGKVPDLIEVIPIWIKVLSHSKFTFFAAFVLHENLEEPLDDEEAVDTGPDDDWDFEVAVMRIELDITQRKSRRDEVKNCRTLIKIYVAR